MKTVSNPLSIRTIIVEKLFGIYTYAIPLDNDRDISKLLILYGDNGSGKTTILKLIFWLLSSRDRSGYKTRIAKTKFKKFSIVLENGIEIGATREDGQIVGSFIYYIKDNNENIFSIHLNIQENVINLEEGSKEEAQYNKILSYIRDLNITVFYLSDDRKILNSLTSSENSREENKFILNESDLILPEKNYERIALKRLLNEQKLSMDKAIERLIDWIRNNTITGSKTGERNSQVIFTDLIKSITRNIENSKKTKSKSKENLILEIEEIEAKIIPYIQLGLIEEFDSKSIKTSIRKSKTRSQLNYLNIILTPYIESINAKLNALEKLKDTLFLLLESINDYYSNKEISFNLNKGFLLKHKNGEDIDFGWLSSGEKQLFLLFINTITSADQATIFIIDEPEISLNIKWQRKLISTLLKFISDNNVQYIFATHSLELLSSNLEFVTKLEEKDGNN